MKGFKIIILVSLFLLLFFYDVLHAQSNIIQICTVRNENEEGIKELRELSYKIIAYDPRYEVHKNNLLRSCIYLGIFDEINPPPEFPDSFRA